jgi:hypothetical protein
MRRDTGAGALESPRRETLATRASSLGKALTAATGGRADISYFSMSAVGVLRIGLAARIRATGSGEARAKLRAAEEPLFEQWRRRFFALDQFHENADRFAITYDEVFAEVEAGDRGRRTRSVILPSANL